MQSTSEARVNTGRSGPLAGLSILEVAGPLGDYTGKQFADLGADVVLVEPVGGASRRAAGPFVDDEPGLERSLTFAYFNTGKRSVALDLDTRDGAALFTELARQSDVVIDGTGSPTLMRSRRIGHPELAAGNPRIVYTHITPFG